MSIRQPLVSVIMPVYNAAPYLADCIESILNQSYKNFEFIIVDDASTDNSLEIMKKYASKNSKIKVFRNYKNKGVSETAKHAILKAKGDFIARMDADDISLTNRLEKQVNYLLKHKDTVAVGGQCFIINKKGTIIGKKTFPTDHDDIYKYIFQFVPIQQPTIMIARHLLPKNFQYYRNGMNTAEEVELFFKLFTFGKIENLPDFVLMYRIHDTNTSFIDVRKTFLLTLISRIKAIYTYDYTPTFTGIIVTLIQASMVLILPRTVILGIYKSLVYLTPNPIVANFKSMLQPHVATN